MYGKCFGSMYEGSMVGAGPVVFAVWGYCIAKADLDGTVLLNPDLLAPVIGTSREEIVSAIQFLMHPDAHSKNPEHEGRRLLHQSGHLYLIVSHHIYREFKCNNDRREYMRKYMEEKRKGNVNINKVNKKLTLLTSASASVSVSASDSEGGCKGELQTGFESFWTAYPRKTGKKAALKAWKAAKDKPDIQTVLAAITAQKASQQWQKDGGQFIPHPATWLNQGRWADETEPIKIGSTGKSELQKRVEETERKFQEAIS